MTRRLLTLAALGALLAAGIQIAAPADAMPLDRVVTTIRDAGGHYEATCCGRPFLIGPEAVSPFDPQFRQFHIDPVVLQ